MLGFKSFDVAQSTLVGIELMHMIKKRQLVVEEGHEGRTAAEQFYGAGRLIPSIDRGHCSFMTSCAKFATKPPRFPLTYPPDPLSCKV